MSPMDGMTLFHEIKAIFPAVPVILLTAYASVETAIEAMKSGAFDYLTKPFKVARCSKQSAGPKRF
jgi:DNA-binding NtrC family response regulator